MCHTKHDSNAVHTFLKKVLNVLKIKHPMLQKLVYFGDGDGSQYKNYKAFSNLCHHESVFGLSAEWYFFVTSHGKSLAVVLEVLSNALLVMQVNQYPIKDV